MAAGHQLKKLVQNRNNNSGFRWTEYFPRQWSSYILLFCMASLIMFCFLFYDFRQSPASLLIHASNEVSALKVQGGDSPAERLSRSTPFEFVVTAEKNSTTVTAEEEVESKQTNPNLSLTTLDDEEKDEISSMFSEVKEPESDPVEDISRPKGLLDDEGAENDHESHPHDDGDEGTFEVVGLKKKVGEIADDDDFLEEVDSLDLEDNSSKEKMDETKSKVSEETVDETEPENENTLLTESNEKLESEGEKTVSEILTEEESTEPVEQEVEELVETSLGSDESEEQKLSIPTSADDSEARVLREVGEGWEIDEDCDFSQGKWVYDESYPIYKPNTCAYLDGGFRCVENGRPNADFQKWRWQPAGCDLPRFNPKKMLERLRDSRMVFVGDSIGRNNWESMLCMLAEGVDNKSSIYEMNGETISKHSGFLRFRFEEYNMSVEYYRAPHLVPQGSTKDRPADPKVLIRSTLKLDQIDWSSGKWRDADIVIFNSGHWWSWGKTIRGGCYFQEGHKIHLNMSVHDAFQKAMETVANFVEKRMDPAKSQVFFRGYAPVHFRGGTWDHGGTCNGDTQPLAKFPFVYEDRTASPMISGVMGKNVRTSITFVNVTYLSDLRPDGHSSIYQRVPHSPMNHQDCSHWCLPGVPDTWNEIIFAKLLIRGQGNWGKQTSESAL